MTEFFVGLALLSIIAVVLFLADGDDEDWGIYP
jgi:hypothetical protein